MRTSEITEAIQAVLTARPTRRRSVLNRTGLVFIADKTTLAQLQRDLTLTHLFSSYCRNGGPQNLRSLVNTPAKTLLGVRLKALAMKDQIIPGSEELLVSLVDDCIRLAGVA